jgi:hypothetical protein
VMCTNETAGNHDTEAMTLECIRVAYQSVFRPTSRLSFVRT